MLIPDTVDTLLIREIEARVVDIFFCTRKKIPQGNEKYMALR